MNTSLFSVITSLPVLLVYMIGTVLSSFVTQKLKKWINPNPLLIYWVVATIVYAVTAYLFKWAFESDVFLDPGVCMGYVVLGGLLNGAYKFKALKRLLWRTK